MGISFVAGQMLNNNLQRGTANLAFQTNLIYLDVVNNRVGINTATPSTDFQVSGNASITGNMIAGNVVTTMVTSVSNLTLSTASGGNITFIPDSTGIVKILGTNGIVIPAGNTAQRPSTPDTGTLRLNTGLDQLEIWDGGTWLTGSGSSGNVTIVDQQITPDGIANAFTLTQSTTQASILVSLNGVGQLPGVAYTVSGNTITFVETPTLADIIDVRFLAASIPPGTLYNNSGNAAIFVTDTPNIVFEVNNTNVATITTSGIFDISAGQSLKLPSYTVAQAGNIASPSTGQVIYVSNGDTGNPCLAVYSDGAWKRVSFGANIST